MNKKGSVIDIFAMGIVLFVLAIGFLAMTYTSSIVTQKLNNTQQFNDSVTAKRILQKSYTMNDRIDYIYFGIFMGLILGIIITGYFIGGHPIFMFIYFIMNIIAVVLSMVFSYAFDKVTASSTFLTTITRYPLMNHIMQNLPVYVTIAGFIGIVVMFAKPRQEGI